MSQGPQEAQFHKQINSQYLLDQNKIQNSCVNQQRITVGLQCIQEGRVDATLALIFIDPDTGANLRCCNLNTLYCSFNANEEISFLKVTV